MPIPLLAAGAGAFSLSTLFKASMVWFVANIACKLLYRVLFSLGIGIAAFVGIDLALSPLEDLIQENLSNLPFDIQGALDRMRVPLAISILLSGFTFSITTRLARTGLSFRGRPTRSQMNSAW